MKRILLEYGIAACVFSLPANGVAQQNPCFTSPHPPPQRVSAPGDSATSSPPPVTCDTPAAGKRVAVTAEEYLGTQVFHALYLPTDWEPGGKYPVIVEYAPNRTNVFDGTVEDTQMGYYQSGGEGFIWITMPFIDYTTTPAKVATTWWGNGSVDDPIGEQLSAEYTKTNLIRTLEKYGGDPSSVFLTGFSRGAIGAGYVGLRDAEMADIWLGFLPHSHHDGGSFTPDPDFERLSRIAGRASFITYGDSTLDGGSSNSLAGVSILDQLGFPVEAHELIGVPHTDKWIEDDATASSLAVRQKLRDWLADTITNKPGTHSILGEVLDAEGRPVEGARIQSGDTHWTFTSINGSYELAGLVDGQRELSVSHPTFEFVNAERQIALFGEDLHNQVFVATQPVPEPASSCLLIGLLFALIARRPDLGHRQCAVFHRLSGSIRSLLTSLTLAAATSLAISYHSLSAESDLILCDFDDDDLTVPELQAEHVTARHSDGALQVKLLSSDGNPTLTWNLPDNLRNLSSHRYLAVDITNLNDKPATLTFWALSGAGWVGMNSAALTDKGREVLDPATTNTLKIDLHGRYSGPDALATAIDPAEVKQIQLVFENRQGGDKFNVDSIRAIGDPPAKTLGQSARMEVPEVGDGPPAAGARVRRTLPEYEQTDLTHVLYLPVEWQASGCYPVIVEYTGNRFYHKFCHSTGYNQQGHLAYGLSRRGGYIALTLPFVSEDGLREQSNGWGNPDKTVDYCLKAIRDACENYGGDPSAVIVTGFSRGALACNYIALRNDQVADVWLAFLGNPNRVLPLGENGWHGSGIGWNERAQRILGRSCFLQMPRLGPAHVDIQYLEQSEATIATEKWLQKVIQAKPGTFSIRGSIIDEQGHPMAGVRVESGPTHFTCSDEAGNYKLEGLVGKSRAVTTAKSGYSFTPTVQHVDLDEHVSKSVQFRAARSRSHSD